MNEKEFLRKLNIRCRRMCQDSCGPTIISRREDMDVRRIYVKVTILFLLALAPL